MDHLGETFRYLVRTIRSDFPRFLAEAFDVATLTQTILPYRHHRRELGLQSNERYERVMLELLAGAGGYLVVDESVRDALAREAASDNPDAGRFREFAGASVMLAPEALRRLEAEEEAAAAREYERPARIPTRPVRQPDEAESAPADASAQRPVRSSKVSRELSPLVLETGGRCRYCNEDLPPGRRITFCPYCGQNLTAVDCPACGSELELGWRFCPVCGRPAASAGDV